MLLLLLTVVVLLLLLPAAVLQPVTEPLHDIFAAVPAGNSGNPCCQVVLAARLLMPPLGDMLSCAGSSASCNVLLCTGSSASCNVLPHASSSTNCNVLLCTGSSASWNVLPCDVPA
jgi:hypothetical protein